MNSVIKLSAAIMLLCAVCLFMISASVPQLSEEQPRTVSPSAAPVYVKSGEYLLVDSNTSYSLKGSLVVESGAELYIKGRFNADKGSTIMNFGTIRIYEGGVLELGGKLLVAEDAAIKGKGTLHVLNRFDDINCAGTVTAHIAAPVPVTSGGITTVGGVLLVNKQYDLPSTYGSGLDEHAYDAFVKMKKASGYENMSIISGFRSYEKQKSTFDYWCSIDGYEAASTYSAEPGHSEHQTGLAMDITSLNQSYGKTAEGRWLAAHCHEYGFIIRYPKGSSHITGYMYEPWHIRYLGVSTAKLVHDSGLTLEEFLGVA